MTAAYDVAVIGAGAAGLTAAGAAAALGAKTVLIEAARFGGDCTWNGCVPSKALLRAAAAAAEARTAARFGVAAPPQIDGRRVLERIRAVRRQIYERADAPSALAKYHVATLHAEARFVDPHTLALDGDAPPAIRARRIIIATGSRPRPVPLGVATIDNESIWELPDLPARVVIIGNGPVAVETAQALCRLGVAVTVIAGSARILPRDEPDAAAVVARALQAEGVKIVTNGEVATAEPSADGVTVTVTNGTTIAADRVFVAAGRTARLAGLDLERAGVAVRDGLVAVDTRCRTSAPHIYAAGDCATNARFTHVAERMAMVAVTNGLVGIPARFDPDAVVWTTFTDPELAHVGPMEDTLRRSGRRYRTATFDFADLDRAIVDDAPAGFARIITTRSGRVLGGTIVGRRAGDLIAEIALARAKRLSLDALAGTMHVYPTYAMSVRRAADTALIRRRTWPVLLGLRLLRGLHGHAPPLDVLLGTKP